MLNTVFVPSSSRLSVVQPSLLHPHGKAPCHPGLPLRISSCAPRRLLCHIRGSLPAAPVPCPSSSSRAPQQHNIGTKCGSGIPHPHRLRAQKPKRQQTPNLIRLHAAVTPVPRGMPQTCAVSLLPTRGNWPSRETRGPYDPRIPKAVTPAPVHRYVATTRPSRSVSS